MKKFIFDFFGVIAEFDNDIVYKRYAKSCPDEEVAFRALNGFMAREEIITGQLNLNDIFSLMVDELSISMGFAEFKNNWIQEYSWKMPGMTEIIKELSNKTEIYILSNIDEYYWETVKKLHDELNLFDSVYLSFEIGLAKPDKKIFEFVLSDIKADAKDCIFIDDTLKNITVAEDIGIEAHQFKSSSIFRSKYLSS